MIQIFPPRQTLGETLGTAIGGGLAGLLEGALDNRLKKLQQKDVKEALETIGYSETEADALSKLNEKDRSLLLEQRAKEKRRQISPEARSSLRSLGLEPELHALSEFGTSGGSILGQAVKAKLRPTRDWKAIKTILPGLSDEEAQQVANLPPGIQQAFYKQIQSGPAPVQEQGLGAIEAEYAPQQRMGAEYQQPSVEPDANALLRQVTRRQQATMPEEEPQRQPLSTQQPQLRGQVEVREQPQLRQPELREQGLAQEPEREVAPARRQTNMTPAQEEFQQLLDTKKEERAARVTAPQLHAQQEERQLDREIARDAQAARQPAKVSPTQAQEDQLRRLLRTQQGASITPGAQPKSYVERVQEAKAKTAAEMNADKRQVEIDKTERKYFDEYISKKAGAEESLGILDQAEGLVKQGQMDNPMFASVVDFFSPVIDLTPLLKADTRQLQQLGGYYFKRLKNLFPGSISNEERRAFIKTIFSATQNHESKLASIRNMRFLDTVEKIKGEVAEEIFEANGNKLPKQFNKLVEHKAKARIEKARKELNPPLAQYTAPQPNMFEGRTNPYTLPGGFTPETVPVGFEVTLSGIKYRNDGKQFKIVPSPRKIEYRGA